MKAQQLITQNVAPKIVVYGKSGTGKTALVSQASKGYMLDFDGGMRTAALLKDKFSDLRNAIEFDTFRDSNPASPSQWMLAKDKLLKISSDVANKKWPYDALIVDSITGMCKAISYQILYQSNKPLGRPEIQHWGLMVSELENILAVITSMNTLVILTGHESVTEEDEIAKVEIASMTANFSRKLPWLFDEVWYMRAKPAPQNQTQYTVSGKSTLSVMARTRSNIGEEVINDIGLEGLLKKAGYSYGSKPS